MNSTFLIKSSKEIDFGTAFCIQKDEKGVFLLTCKHVIESCGEDSLEVNQRKAILCSNLEKSDSLDLAVVYVEGLEAKPKPLTSISLSKGHKFVMDGFKHHKKESYKRERLNGSIKKISQIYSNNRSIDTYELNIGSGDSIERGYSGSAIVSDGVVVGVATDRTNSGKQAYAVPIKYLSEIWEDMPEGLFISHQFPKLKKINLLDISQKYLLTTVIGVIILGMITNYLYDILNPPPPNKESRQVSIKENNSTNSIIELRNDSNSSVSKKELEFTKNQIKNSTIKVSQ